METKFNYSKVYYKVTNEKECHHGYQYKDGLNILKEEFNDNPEHSCVPGGFYFTDYEHLHYFFHYGMWIREVTIPTDARVVLDPDGNKWRCDKIILGKKYHIENDFDKWFDPEKFNQKHSKYLAEFCSNQFDKWFDPNKFNWKYLRYLAEFCSDHFDKWFDKEKFNWDYSDYLAQFCSQHFNKWFDKEKFNWKYSRYLAEFCSNHFDKWFDPNKFNWDYYLHLIECCNSQFTLWKQEHPELLQDLPALLNL